MSSSFKILLVEDDLSIGTLLFDLIKKAGYSVEWARNGNSALEKFSAGNYSCMLLDIMMPERNGYEVLEQVRTVDSDIPVIILTAKSEIADKKQAFDLGADDYVVKPFDWEELELRLAAQHRKQSAHNSGPKALGTLFFDASKQLLYRDNWEQKLTGRETQILNLLIQAAGEVIDRDNLLNLVWGHNSYQNSRSLDVFISRLRGYLKKDSRLKINNIHGKGYALQSS
ncbi:MAG: response regulator transcription factor [Luteibaculum sp.]